MKGLLKPLRTFEPPIADMIDRISYVRMQKLFDPFFPPGRYTYTKSNFFRALSDEAIEAMASFADTAPSPYIFAPFLNIGTGPPHGYQLPILGDAPEAVN